MVQETSFGNDRDQKTKRTATVTKGTRGNVSHNVRTQSISQERGTRLSSFVLKRMFTRGDPSLPHTMTSVPGSSVLCLKRDKGLMRDSTQESSHQTFPDNSPLFIYNICNKSSDHQSLFGFNNLCMKATTDNKYSS